MNYIYGEEAESYCKTSRAIRYNTYNIIVLKDFFNLFIIINNASI